MSLGGLLNWIEELVYLYKNITKNEVGDIKWLQ